ncbi:restriction system-associated AAA family ATPase [Lacinutrix sp. MEBiC02595]
MKLLRLKINSPFNSLRNKVQKNFELNFREPFYESENASWESFHPFCFAGLNGSGKSNVLEALANIFYHLENCANTKQPQNFLEQFNETKSSPDAFELEYYIVPNDKTDFVEETLRTGQKGLGKAITGIEKSNYALENMVKVEITKEKGKKLHFEGKNIHTDEIIISSLSIDSKGKPVYNIKTLKPYLPDLIIGYSSGENEVLSIPFLKSRLLNYDEYYDTFPDIKYYSPENNLVYIDYEMSQAVLLVNYIFQNNEVLKPLREGDLGIQEIVSFRMTLNTLHIEKDNKEYKILDQYQSKIDALKRCSTTFYEGNTSLTLDFYINKATKEAFRNKKNFKDISDLFQTFQVLYTLNYLVVSTETKNEVYQSEGVYTDWKIPKPAPKDKVFYFENFYIKKEGVEKPLLLKNLSDGEQQFLHSLGICLMLKGKSALLLLDEPETHFNPDWRSKFISTLKVCLEASSSNNLMRDILITSHSPFIISDCYPDKVIVFEKGEQPKNARDINFRTYGTSIDIIMENIFKKNNTIGDLSRGEIEDIEEEINGLESLTEEEVIDYKNKTIHLGDSMEKVLLFAQLNELKKK